MYLIAAVVCLEIYRQVNNTWLFITYPYPWHTWFDIFVTGDRELAPGNLNPLPVEAEQLTCTVSREVNLTLALNSSYWRKVIKVRWRKSSTTGGTLLSHVCLGAASYTVTLRQQAGSQ